MVLYSGGQKSAYAPVAQLDRVFGYEPKGRGFESLQPYQDKLTSFERNLSIFFLQKSQEVHIKYQAAVKLTAAIFYA